MNKVVLFDIDYTLFDARAYRDKGFLALAEKAKYADQKKFVDTAVELYSAQRRAGYYDQPTFLADLIQMLELKTDVQALTAVMADPILLTTSLFEETEAVLGKIAEKATIGVFSGGRIDTQRQKIEKIKHHFNADHIFINPNDKKNEIPAIIERYKDTALFLVDDLADVLAAVKKMNGSITTIWIKRGVHAKDYVLKDEEKPDFTILTLNELVDIIGK